MTPGVWVAGFSDIWSRSRVDGSWVWVESLAAAAPNIYIRAEWDDLAPKSDI